MIVSAPASTANLGPAFDALGIALDLRFELSDRSPSGGADNDHDHGPPWHVAEATHPAVVAHRRAGGNGPLWWRSPIPPGRGLGYSAAARVAGAALATLQAGGDLIPCLSDVFSLAADLEEHPDNAAPAVYGGVMVAVDDQVIPITPPSALGVLVWSPSLETSTASSRSRLPDSVPFDDAVFNVGRTALLVAALATGRFDALATATHDRLHQPHRVAAHGDVAIALDMLSDHTVAAWLSGSGPSVAAFVEPETSVDEIADHLPAGRCRMLSITDRGVSVDHEVGSDPEAENETVTA